MSVVDSLEQVKTWLEDVVCKDVRLKPMSIDGPQDEAFEYQLVKPTVHIMYLPPHEARPPGAVATIPAIVIQLVESRDDLKAQLRELKLRLSFSVFDPGTHGPDVMTPTEETSFDVVSPTSLELGPYRFGEAGTLQVNMDGWRDALSFMDRFLRDAESAGDIAGLAIKRDDGITFAPYAYEEEGDLQYPFWACWCRLTLLVPFIRNPDVPNTKNQAIESML